jgi:hypothetical protein
MGKIGRVEGIVSKFLFLSVRILGARIILRRGRFVTPCFSPRNKTLENCLYE